MTFVKSYGLSYQLYADDTSHWKTPNLVECFSTGFLTNEQLDSCLYLMMQFAKQDTMGDGVKCSAQVEEGCSFALVENRPSENEKEIQD